MHLADAFIQSDLQCIQAVQIILSVSVFPGNQTHNLYIYIYIYMSILNIIDSEP